MMIVLAPAAELRLEAMSKETKRTVENIAAAAVEEAALNYFKHRKDDPVEALRASMKEGD